VCSKPFQKKTKLRKIAKAAYLGPKDDDPSGNERSSLLFAF